MNDVQFWLFTIHIGDGKTFGQYYANQFKANDVDGKMLEDANEEMLKFDLCITSQEKRKLFLNQVEQLKIERSL